MRYFYDTEFIEDGHTIELISIGVVAEDGREYYAVSTEFDPERAAAGCAPMCCPSCRRPPRNCGARASRFVLTWKNSSASTARIRSSCGLGGAYDHVALCQLWGPMTALPPTVPRFTRELRQLWEDRGCPRMPPRPRDVHDALVDARDQLRRFRLITSTDDAGRGAAR